MDYLKHWIPAFAGMTTRANIDFAAIPHRPAPGYPYRMIMDLLRIYG